ncbi:MAG: cobalamin-binding protein [Egibacteraceae bacterium]
MLPPRILSLVPSATDWVTALGFADAVVGMTHECALPPGEPRPGGDGRHVPVVVRPAVHHDPTDPAGVDAAVTAAARGLRPLYDLDEELVRELAPTVIVTQQLCDVCAVSASTVHRAAAAMSGAAVVNMTGVTLEGVLGDGLALGAALGTDDRAHALVASLRARLGAVAAAVADAPRPSVAFLEWTDPAWIGGHWVPDQIAAAGGSCAVGVSGEPSRRGDLRDLAGADVLIVGPCGYDLDEAHAAAGALGERLPDAAQVWAVDAQRSWSRPAPWLVDGVEALAGVLHPAFHRPPDRLHARRLVPAAGEQARA